jgi:hypothetical protein
VPLDRDPSLCDCDLVRKFTTLCDLAFRPVLDEYGFARVERRISHRLASHVYRAGERYVRVTATEDQRDGPSHCEVLLGEGLHDWPEGDWNQIALWQLVNDVGPERLLPDSGYRTDGPGGLEEALRRASIDLAHHAVDFLSGDVRRFLQVRAARVAARSPYRILAADQDGRYVEREDPQSAGLRHRFAKKDSAKQGS